jgi:predicted phage-related endonuclease
MENKKQDTKPMVEITELDLNAINQLAKIKLKIKQLEEQAKALEEQVKPVIQTLGTSKGNVNGTSFTASVGSRKTYLHSLETRQLEEELKEAKKAEIDSGKAIVSKESTYITYRFK